MVVIGGYFRVPGGVNGDFMPHVLEYVAAVRAEPGCRSFTFAIDVNDPELIRAFEIFEDRDAFAAHVSSPHIAKWKAARAQFGANERVMNLYDIASVEAV